MPTLSQPVTPSVAFSLASASPKRLGMLQPGEVRPSKQLLQHLLLTQCNRELLAFCWA